MTDDERLLRLAYRAGWQAGWLHLFRTLTRVRTPADVERALLRVERVLRYLRRP